MINKIFVDGILIVSSGIEKQRRFFVFEDGSKKFKNELDYLDVVCGDCSSINRLQYSNHFILKKNTFLCRRCRSTGVRNGMYGKTHSAEYRKVCSDRNTGVGNPFYGRHHSEESRRKQSKSKIGKQCGNKNPMYGKSWKDIVRKTMSAENFEIFLKKRRDAISKKFMGTGNPFYGKTHSATTKELLSKKSIAHSILPGVKERQRNEAFERLRKSKYKMTKPEKIIRELLIELSIPNHYNFILDNKYQYDFRIYDSNVLIEVHGDYWHANPKKYPDGPKTERQIFKVERDKLKSEYATQRGYVLLYIWEDDIKNDINSVRNRLVNEIQIG